MKMRIAPHPSTVSSYKISGTTHAVVGQERHIMKMEDLFGRQWGYSRFTGRLEAQRFIDTYC